MQSNIKKTDSINLSLRAKLWVASSAAITSLLCSSGVIAQDEGAEGALEEVVVTGIRSSLKNALDEKRASDNLVEVIQAVDIGKLPDQNLAEVLENVTGIQITRTAGVGTGVQIRGTNANRTEINGVSTVGSGSGRSGISFEDVSASMISAVEVTKSPEAKTIEGSVGGTINLRTIRPLDLTDRVASVRVQTEKSNLSTDSATPRISGTYGNNWTTSRGEFGAVASLSYSEQDVSAFRPRTDRDNDRIVDANRNTPGTTEFDFLPVQFFVQDYDNFEYETTNFAGTLEFAPNDNLKFYFDTLINDQERRQESSRIQASGISSAELSLGGINTQFETVDFGSLNGQDLGSIQAAVSGIIPVEANGTDRNLRFSGDTNSRLTDTSIFSLGVDWNKDKLSGRVEVATSSSDTTTPSFNTTLNFLNPNVALNSSNENGTPFIYDLTGGSLTFAILQDPAYNGPTTEQLLDPANVVLRDVNIGQNAADSRDDAFRADFTYDHDGDFITSVDAGFRYNKIENTSNAISARVGLRSLADSPSGDLFASLLTAGPTNFNDADGRALYVRDFLTIDPEQVAADPTGALNTLNAAITAHGGSRSINNPTSSASAFFDIEEETSAIYAQANFERGIFRGNAGLRYLTTSVLSQGNSVLNGVVSPTSTKNSYDFVLPRINIVADVRDDVILRAGWGKDINRPNFANLSTSFNFGTSPNTTVNLGNPGLVPEKVDSFDISAEWYFAPSAVLSAGYFHKTRTGLFVQQSESPFEDDNGFRDLTAPCEAGGIFNPIADINVFGPDVGVGVCVPSSQIINGAGDNTQKGFELAGQYDLSEFEDRLGWASGFGFIANYTKQEFSGGDEVWSAFSRPSDIFFASGGATDVELTVTEIDLSENAYNTTLYYEKYGLSARMRYTWRDAYRSTDFGSTSSFPWGFPVVQDDRGQLNLSVNYDVNEKLNVGLEVTNLTESDITQYCVNENALLCYQGLTDRRVIVGASYKF